MNSFFDTSFYTRPKVDNILDKLPNNSDIKKTIIPVYEITFVDSSGFGAYVVEDENENQFNIKGVFVSQLIVGQTYSVQGKVTSYKNEKQIGVEKIKNVRPVNKKGLIAYLQTLKGLKTKAELIYEEFGDKCIEVLIKDPMIVAKSIKGIGKKSVENWQEQLLKMQDAQETISTLLGYGLSHREAKKLYDKYKDEIIVKLEENPYVLAVEVKGYGFEKCDRIARGMGYNPKSEYRIQEGIMHVLKNSLNDGHCYLPGDDMVEKAIELINIRLSVQEMHKFSSEHSGSDTFLYSIGEYNYKINYTEMKKSLYNYNESKKRDRTSLRHIVVGFEHEDILAEMRQLIIEGRLIIEDKNIYLTEIYKAEKLVAEYITDIVKHDVPLEGDFSKRLLKLCSDKGIILEEMQKKAVLDFSKTKGGFHVLNGSAGCGKTFTLNIILEILTMVFKDMKKQINIMVLAPTGKASKVASEATGRDCKTVHRGLGYNPKGGFEFNEYELLEADVVVVDESSMLDIELTKALLSAIPKTTKVIFLGDIKQLPSVGAGNVLKDLIESDAVNIVTLNVVKRQGEKSGIIRNANRIIAGEMIETCEDTEDAYVIERETPKGSIDAMISSIKRIQKIKGWSLEDIQVLCPQKSTPIGTEYMNYVLQNIFNPNKDGLMVLNKKLQMRLSPEDRDMTNFELYFRAGDKVMHIKNNYDIPWFEKGNFGYIETNETGITNGECGVIEEIIKDKNEDGDTITKVIVRYDDKYIIYDDGVSELEHAYALTIHKSQGSQWKAVIIPIMKQNYTMLDNNLFYTAYTRAKYFSVVVGQISAIKHAIKTQKTRTRFTSLSKKIKENNLMAS